LRQAYDYWQDQPGNHTAGQTGGAPRWHTPTLAQCKLNCNRVKELCKAPNARGIGQGIGLHPASLSATELRPNTTATANGRGHVKREHGTPCQYRYVGQHTEGRPTLQSQPSTLQQGITSRHKGLAKHKLCNNTNQRLATQRAPGAQALRAAAKHAKGSIGMCSHHNVSPRAMLTGPTLNEDQPASTLHPRKSTARSHVKPPSRNGGTIQGQLYRATLLPFLAITQIWDKPKHPSRSQGYQEQPSIGRSAPRLKLVGRPFGPTRSSMPATHGQPDRSHRSQHNGIATSNSLHYTPGARGRARRLPTAGSARMFTAPSGHKEFASLATRDPSQVANGAYRM